VSKSNSSCWRDDAVNRIIRYPTAIAMRFRIFRLRRLGVQIGRRCWIQSIRVPRNPWDITLGDGVALDEGVVLLTNGPRTAIKRIRIGGGSYINRFTIFDASEEIVVGKNCMIGPLCYITDHDHGYEKGQLIGEQPLRSGPVRIGSNVWVGAGVIILKGVSIGNGAVIGAGGVVNKNVDPGARVAGVPARNLPEEAGIK